MRKFDGMEIACLADKRATHKVLRAVDFPLIHNLLEVVCLHKEIHYSLFMVPQQEAAKQS